MVTGCEVIDYVVNPDTTRVVRQQNEAANNELTRRGGADRWGTVVASGELAPYAVAWVNTCDGTEVVVPGS